MRIPIAEHPTKVTLTAGFEGRGRWQKQNHKYSLELNPAEPIDRQQFKQLLFAGQIDFSRLNGQLKELSSFEPSFGEKPLAGILVELSEAYGSLGPVEDEHRTKQAEALIIQEAINQSHNPSDAEKLVEAMEKSERLSRIAKTKIEMTGRQIESLKSRILSEIQAHREKEFKVRQKRFDAAVETFNAGIEQVYKTFWRAAKEDLLAMVDLRPGQFGGISFISPNFEPIAGGKLKGLLMFPTVAKSGDSSYLFELKEVKLK